MRYHAELIDRIEAHQLEVLGDLSEAARAELRATIDESLESYLEDVTDRAFRSVWHEIATYERAMDMAAGESPDDYARSLAGARGRLMDACASVLEMDPACMDALTVQAIASAESPLDRLRRIVLSAVKQSRKAWVSELKGMTPFKSLIGSIGEETRAYICHCHEGRKEHLDDVLRKTGPHEGETLVMVGPEGDFSREEVEEALKAGAVPVSLGGSRLRTETAGLVAAHIMHLNNEIRYA